MGIVYSAKLSEDDVERMKNGKMVTLKTSMGPIELEMDSCEDGHDWNSPHASNGVLVRKCKVCDTTEKTVAGLEKLMDDNLTVLDRV